MCVAKGLVRGAASRAIASREVAAMAPELALA
jgi:hypothetical protein